MDNNNLVARFKSLESERKGSIEQVWDLIEQFVLPFRGDFYASLTSENEVDWHRRDIYDSTASFALSNLAASIHGNLTSPSDQWFKLKFRDETLNKVEGAMEWLEACTDICFEALMDSNFNIEISEAYTDMGGYGTTVLTEEAADEVQWQGLSFSACPVRECFFEEDFNKGVLRFYRRLQLTPAQIVDKFGKDKVPQDIIDLADKGGQASSQKQTVIFVIQPVEANKGADTSGLLAPELRPYEGKYILEKSKTDLGDPKGYYEMPAFIGRWRKIAGSKWGHSPAFIALGDILTLNQLIESILEALGKVIDPAILADENALIGNLDFDRGTLNTVLDINGVKAFESSARFDVGTLEVNMLRESIRKAFFQDQLELKDSPQMTATEVNVRYEMIQKLLGPTATRIQHDILDPLVERTFKILFRAQQLPKAPENLRISQLDIEYTGPLPRSQRIDTAMAIDRWITSAVEKVQLLGNPDLLDLIDFDEAERTKARLLGVPAQAVRSEDAVKQLRKQRAEEQQKAEAIAKLQQGGEAAKAVGEGKAALQAVGDTPEDMAAAAGNL